ncbi:Bug family tripartite tricarboxylate transporter substrate binding protein [Schauerella aestuarii]|uniref:Bug family tripartite tricarboxylate transporter substrate binding protein n=1 Tax=Schauerella aestuarii TaxID=2511204 RepID=UPI00136CEF25|nr:tripartite tricarboxylate transporter substrate binding protein [Achromobacter aestuarii]MYZ44747.1 tripartite tricarboxylate transporter substrate binding protein [Achromobacter aestuarii]
MKRLICRAIAAACITVACVNVHAQSYPDRPVRIIVPSPPGGSTDQLARLMGQKLGEKWGQTVVIENKPGAGLTLGADYVTKQPPDGYTLLMGALHHSIAPAVYKSLPYDFQRDLTPITVVAVVPNVLIVPQSLPAKSVAELIALARAKPGSLTYGSTGAGTAHHLIGEQFNDMAGVQTLHVPYKGSGPALIDLMGGRIDMMFDTVASCLPHIQSGKVRALAVATSTRSSALPDVPTLDEAGLKGFDIATWFGFLAPTGTPQAVIDKVHRDTVAILKDQSIQKQLLAMGAEPVGNTPQEMTKQIADETVKFKALAQKANLSIE